MVKLKFPKPRADINAYEKVLKEGFKNFPLREENYRNFLDNKEHLAIKLDIEVSPKCNFQCTICDLKRYDYNRGENLGLEDFKKIIDEQIGVIELRLAGVGEPFLNKNFIEMVKYAREKDIWVRVVTNGSLLHIDGNFRNVIDADINEIMISIDGITKNTFESIRVNSNYEQIVKNVTMLNEYATSKNKINTTKMWVTIQDLNFKELTGFVKFAHELKFKKIGINLSLHIWGNKNWENKILEKTVKVSQKEIDTLLEQADKLGIELGIEHVSEKYNKNNICKWPFDRMYISADQYLVPCCMVGTPDTVNFGKYSNWKEEWNKGEYTKLRRQHLTMRLPSYCEHCYE
jgi:pyrroloquinoline quinone biosynthesis protein E